MPLEEKVEAHYRELIITRLNSACPDDHRQLPNFIQQLEAFLKDDKAAIANDRLLNIYEDILKQPEDWVEPKNFMDFASIIKDTVKQYREHLAGLKPKAQIAYCQERANDRKIARQAKRPATLPFKQAPLMDMEQWLELQQQKIEGLNNQLNCTKNREEAQRIEQEKDRETFKLYLVFNNFFQYTRFDEFTEVEKRNLYHPKVIALTLEGSINHHSLYLIRDMTVDQYKRFDDLVNKERVYLLASTRSLPITRLLEIVWDAKAYHAFLTLMDTYDHMCHNSNPDLKIEQFYLLFTQRVWNYLQCLSWVDLISFTGNTGIEERKSRYKTRLYQLPKASDFLSSMDITSLIDATLLSLVNSYKEKQFKAESRQMQQQLVLAMGWIDSAVVKGYNNRQLQCIIASRQNEFLNQVKWVMDLIHRPNDAAIANIKLRALPIVLAYLKEKGVEAKVLLNVQRQIYYRLYQAQQRSLRDLAILSVICFPLCFIFIPILIHRYLHRPLLKATVKGQAKPIKDTYQDIFNKKGLLRKANVTDLLQEKPSYGFVLIAPRNQIKRSLKRAVQKPSNLSSRVASDHRVIP